LLARGKVRDNYARWATDRILMVASDRISAFDVVMGATRSWQRRCCSPKWRLYWFDKLGPKV
jgi:phosphoribosylaminoimidazole-succinocarboxamide synthase